MNEYRKSLLYGVLFCLSLAIYAGYDTRASYLKEEENTRLRVANTSFLISEWIKGAFLASDYVLRDIISQVPLSGLHYPASNPTEQARITDFLITKLKTVPFAVGVGLHDKHCVITHTWNIPPRHSIVGFDGSEREWCKRPQADPSLETFVTNMFLSNTGKMAVIQLRRFPEHAFEFSGLAGIGVGLDFFSKWLEQVLVAPHGVIAIADMNLKLLARKPVLPEMLGKSVSEPLTQAFIASDESYKTVRFTSPLDGKDRLYGLRKVDDLPFVIVVGEADMEWLASWRQRAWFTGAALLLLWGLAIFTLRHHWAMLRHREELSSLANTDALTGIANRRNFIIQAERELSRANRYDSGLAVLLLDIDHFKEINDTYGHAIGDQAIISFSKACIAALRDVDLFGRLGGDEFAILLPNTSVEEARVVAERVRHSVESYGALKNEGVAVLMTCSIGVVMVDASEKDIESALAKADAALYLSKKAGRNKVELNG
jgi:diguanylate cyclase (GGDEF)-like protein